MNDKIRDLIVMEAGEKILNIWSFCIDETKRKLDHRLWININELIWVKMKQELRGIFLR